MGEGVFTPQRPADATNALCPPLVLNTYWGGRLVAKLGRCCPPSWGASRSDLKVFKGKRAGEEEDGRDEGKGRSRKTGPERRTAPRRREEGGSRIASGGAARASDGVGLGL